MGRIDERATVILARARVNPEAGTSFVCCATPRRRALRYVTRALSTTLFLFSSAARSFRNSPPPADSREAGALSLSSRAELSTRPELDYFPLARSPLSCARGIATRKKTAESERGRETARARDGECVSAMFIAPILARGPIARLFLAFITATRTHTRSLARARERAQQPTALITRSIARASESPR